MIERNLTSRHREFDGIHFIHKNIDISPELFPLAFKITQASSQLGFPSFYLSSHNDQKSYQLTTMYKTDTPPNRPSMLFQDVFSIISTAYKGNLNDLSPSDIKAIIASESLSLDTWSYIIGKNPSGGSPKWSNAIISLKSALKKIN